MKRTLLKSLFSIKRWKAWERRPPWDQKTWKAWKDVFPWWPWDVFNQELIILNGRIGLLWESCRAVIDIYTWGHSAAGRLSHFLNYPWLTLDAFDGNVRSEKTAKRAKTSEKSITSENVCQITVGIPRCFWEDRKKRWKQCEKASKTVKNVKKRRKQWEMSLFDPRCYRQGNEQKSEKVRKGSKRVQKGSKKDLFWHFWAVREASLDRQNGCVTGKVSEKSEKRPLLPFGTSIKRTRKSMYVSLESPFRSFRSFPPFSRNLQEINWLLPGIQEKRASKRPLFTNGTEHGPGAVRKF